MITPAYSPTATERVLPRLALDFTTASLDPRVTVTRALNTATAINSSGFIAIVNANLPRFDYDPVALTCKGLLIEEARTNLFIQSQFQGNWTANAGTTTFLGTYVTSPDGTSNGRILNDTSAAAAAYVFQGVSFTSGTVYTLSVYVKKGVSRYFALTSFTQSGRALFDLDNYSLSSVTGIVTSATITNVGGGWYRCTATMTASATGSNNLGFGDFEAGPTGDLYYIWGAQVEAGAFATSYIPTTTLAVLRNADDVTMSGTNFTSWYNASEGSLSLKYLKSTTQVSGRYVARFFSPTVGAGVSYWINANGIDTRYWIGATNAAIGNGSLVNVNTGAFSYKTATSTGALNGAANVANAGTVPLDVTEFRIGDAGGINAHIQRILYWPFALTAAEIRANSKG